MTVCEETNPELFWALRGAGHNFGIVTQAKIRIYDPKPDLDQWSIAGFVFTHDKMEDVMAIANTWLQSPDRPVGFSNYGIFAFNPEVDAVNVSRLPSRAFLVVILIAGTRNANLLQRRDDPIAVYRPTLRTLACFR